MSPADREVVHAALDVLLDALAAASRPPRDELVPLAAGVPELGITGRVVLDAHRRKEISNVSRVSRKLVAPRSEIDRWLSSRPAVAREPIESLDDDALLARAGLRVIGGSK